MDSVIGGLVCLTLSVAFALAGWHVLFGVTLFIACLYTADVWFGNKG